MRRHKRRRSHRAIRPDRGDAWIPFFVGKWWAHAATTFIPKSRFCGRAPIGRGEVRQFDRRLPTQFAGGAHGLHCRVEDRTHWRASRRSPAIAISADSARPSSLTRAHIAALSGHRLITSDFAASFAASLPRGMPTRRFQCAGVMKEIGTARAPGHPRCSRDFCRS
jgi:hypothetical protein